MSRLIAGGTIAFALSLMGCATVMEGRSERIALNVTPENAQCFGWRHGKVVGAYDPTSQSMVVSKSKDDLMILCRAYGYQAKRVWVAPTTSDWDVPGVDAVDYVTGALHRYDGPLVIVMDQEQ
jgi:hypothetical protein